MSVIHRHLASFVRRPATARALSTATATPTHYRVTLRRSPISLGDSIKATVATLGLTRRMQTVYHPISPECAGKILKIKELVEVANVPASEVKSQEEQRRERRPTRGFSVQAKWTEAGF
ncbi:hypothetical protein JAAARDRAFT_33858 [Jaapia argillacea MUCL 33604]|uniref:Large ribosomal subunit protein uL30m n=1 Tax=Jaapia argillacea MUCL 33604 TaxID=933084 RepID=A0A067Q6L8_9AGAM|nr:hypothetical protein JAAARDRAFT_33858 [Jaapia argillacea MUCL 33604]